MNVLRVILGDQLSLDLAALDDLDPARDTVLMMEVVQETTYVRHHKQKIVLVLSAMRHFADVLRQRGVRVDYVKLDAPDNTGSLTTEVQRAVARHKPGRIMVTEPGEWRVQARVGEVAAPGSLLGREGVVAGGWSISIARCGVSMES